ncbi:putative integral membrane protein [Seiridium unicorne]|uniref:Integral membrane protein n=1 Tax=Seiridium unicorne TaxID=138068 RepID=A0ABR2VHR9_9PEZI
MAFELWKNSAQWAQFLTLIIFTPLGIAVTLLRFVATHRSARKPSLEDWLALTATIFFVLNNLAALMATSILNGRSIPEEIAESMSDYVRMRKWDMAALDFYFVQCLVVKLSVLALYRRIFGAKRAYRVWIYILSGIQSLWCLFLVIGQLLQCKPFYRYFDITIEGTCTDEGTFILGCEVPNSLVDFAMVVLAMLMIRPLQLSARTKWKLRVLFGLGGLVGVIGFIKIAITYSTSTLYAFSMISVWSDVQMFVSILCCCLPVIHPMMPTTSFWGQLSSRIISYATFGRVSRPRTGIPPSEGSVKRSEGNMGSKQNHGWENLDEHHSTMNLAWSEAPPPEPSGQAFGLNEFPTTQAENSETSGIRVQREFAIV